MAADTTPGSQTDAAPQSHDDPKGPDRSTPDPEDHPEDTDPVPSAESGSDSPDDAADGEVEGAGSSDTESEQETIMLIGGFWDLARNIDRVETDDDDTDDGHSFELHPDEGRSNEDDSEQARPEERHSEQARPDGSRIDESRAGEGDAGGTCRPDGSPTGEGQAGHGDTRAAGRPDESHSDENRSDEGHAGHGDAGGKGHSDEKRSDRSSAGDGEAGGAGRLVARRPATGLDDGVSVSPGGFWDLAKKGVAAWGHEPSVGEMVDYWRGLIDDVRTAESDDTTQIGLPASAQPLGEREAPFDTEGTSEPDPTEPSVWEEHAAPSSGPTVTEGHDAEDVGREPAADLDDTIQTDTIDLDDTIELDELVELAGLADMAVLLRPPDDAPRPATSGAPDVGVRGSDESDAATEPGEPTATAPLPDDGPPRPLGLAGGGVTFAGCLASIERRRRAQQRHRPTGRQIAMPAAPLDVYERELRHGVDRATAGLVDVALRAAAAAATAGAASAASPRLPPLRWVEASSDTVTLVLDASRPAPAAFAPVGATCWRTVGDVDELAELAAPVLAPIRALVPLGTTAEGQELLVDLESRGLVTVDGPPEDVLGLLRAAAVALGSAPWSDPLEVVVVGLDRELEVLPGVRVVDDLDTALSLAESHAARIDRLSEATGHASADDETADDEPLGDPVDDGSRERRTQAVAGRGWAGGEMSESLVIVSAVAPEDDDARERLAALARRPGRGVGLLFRHPSGVEGLDARRTGIDSDGRLQTDGVEDLDVWRIGIDGDGRLQADGIEVDAAARRLDEVETTALIALLDIASHCEAHRTARGHRLDARRPPAPGAGEPGRATATGQAPGLDDLLADVDVMVRVLGEVDVVRVGDDGPAKDLAGGPSRRSPDPRFQPATPAALEVVAYLALSASPVSYGSLQVNLCVAGSDAAGALDHAVDAARQLLGEELLPAPTRGRYALSDRVVTDYGLLCALVAHADAADDPNVAADVLTAAVELVRGAPLSGAGQAYAWAGPQREAIVARVVDLAERLAEHHLANGQWHAAAEAAHRGLAALPCDERLYRLLMRSAHGRSDVAAVHQVFEELCDAIADPDRGVEPDDTLHPETIELLEQLVSRRSRRPAASSDQATAQPSDQAADEPTGDHLAA